MADIERVQNLVAIPFGNLTFVFSEGLVSVVGQWVSDFGEKGCALIPVLFIPAKNVLKTAPLPEDYCKQILGIGEIEQILRSAVSE